MTVSLVSSTGDPVRNTESAVTDRAGYFALTLSEQIVNGIISGAENAGAIPWPSLRREAGQFYRSKTPLAIKPRARIRHDVALNRDLTGKPGDGTKPPDEETITVPNIMSLPEENAVAALKEAGLSVGERNTRPVIDQIGLVLEQDPAAGAPVSPQSPVALVIGVAQEVEMPDLCGTVA